MQQPIVLETTIGPAEIETMDGGQSLTYEISDNTVDKEFFVRLKSWSDHKTHHDGIADR